MKRIILIPILIGVFNCFLIAQPLKNEAQMNTINCVARNNIETNFSLEGLDIGISTIVSPVSDYCGFNQLQPTVWVKNYSDIEITNFNIFYRLDFFPLVSLLISEPVSVGDSILVEFDVVTINTGDHAIQFSCSSPNGTADGNNSNNNKFVSFNYSNGKHIKVSIQTDTYSSETSWDIVNSQSQIVTSGSGYAANSLNEYYYCLPPDCYVFTIYDSYGDGICSGYGNGYYLLEDLDDEIEIGTGCSFTTFLSDDFCLVTPPGPPITNFNHSTIDNCLGTVKFFDNSACNPSATAWLWNFGDGTISTEQNPEHIYNSNGFYNVSLQVTNINGSRTLTIPNSVQIEKVNPPFIANEHFCFGENVSFFSPNSVPMDWYTHPNDEDPIQVGASIAFASLTHDTTVYYQHIFEIESTYFGINDNAGVGGYFNFAIDRAVYFDALTDITIKSAKVYASGAGNRTFTLKNSGGTVLDTRVIDIPDGESRINLNFHVAAGDDYAIHLNNTNNLSFTGDYDGPDLGYPFTAQGLISITGNNYNNSFWYFFYNIEVIQGNGNTCTSNRAALNAIMSPLTVELGNDTLVCNGNSILLSPGADYTEYIWNDDTEDSSLEVTQTGNYAVTTTDIYSCIANGSINIEIAEELVFNELIQHPSTIESEDGSIKIEIISGTEPYDIIWSNSSTDFTLTALAPGQYAYTITDGKGCEHTGSITISNSGDIPESENQNVSIFPNPVSTNLIIEATDNEFTISINDINGKEVYRFNSSSNKFEADISTLSPGLYFLTIKGSDFEHKKKIIKE